MEDIFPDLSTDDGRVTMDFTSPLLSLWLFPNISSTTTTTATAVAAVPPENAETLQIVRYAMQKVCVPIVVGLGVIGNILNMLVLTRRSMMNSTNCYLTALAAFDTLYLVFSLTLSFKHYDGFDRDTVYVYWYPHGRVLTDMAANVSVLLTVTFTVERYIGVCHPMKGRVLCTPQRAKIIIALVAFVGVSCTVPELFEMEVVWRTDRSVNQTYPAWQYTDRSVNQTYPAWQYTDRSVNQTYPAWQYTDFSSTYSYQIGYYWFFVTVFTFLPLVLLCIFNGILITTLFKAAELRTRMTSSSPSRMSERYSREQQWITKMLVTVVLVFILCQLPGALLLLIWSYNELAHVQVTPYGRNQLLMAGNVTNLLIQLNASINFILYSMTSTKFRRVFCRTLCLAAKSTSASSIFHSAGRSSVFKNGAVPMTTMTGSVRHGSAKILQRNSTNPRHGGGGGSGGGDKKHHLCLLLKHQRPRSPFDDGGGSRENGSLVNAHAWNRMTDMDGISPTTETYYTDTCSDKEL